MREINQIVSFFKAYSELVVTYARGNCLAGYEREREKQNVLDVIAERTAVVCVEREREKMNEGGRTCVLAHSPEASCLHR